jgi:hypothetical protein
MRRHLQQALALLSLSFMILIPASAAAATKSASKTTASSSSSTSSNTDITQAVTQSYNAPSSVELGMIVQLNPKDATSVEPLASATIQDMLGVRVNSNDASITLSSQATGGTQQIFVATSGRYNVLVSDQNGPILVGSYITISALNGVGMLADQTESVVLGKADGSFNGTSNVQGTTSLKNSQGQTVKVAIGTIPVDLSIIHNPLASKQTDYVPSFLAKTATTISSKPVSAARIYLGLTILLVSAAVTANVVYSGVRSGMQAIGRNPLSKKSIIRSLVQTVIAGLIIFIVGIFAVYLLLKL